MQASYVMQERTAPLGATTNSAPCPCVWRSCWRMCSCGRHEWRCCVSQTSPAQPMGPRPALVTFAAIMLLMLGGFELVLAVTEFFRYAFGTLPPLADAT